MPHSLLKIIPYEMSLSKVKVIKDTNNLGRARQGNDHISGLLVFDSIPSQFGTDNVKLVGSVTEAEALGITVSSYPVLHYHISEYFRLAGNSSLYVGIFFHAGSNAYTFDEVQTMQRASGGVIRQLGVYLQDNVSSGIVNLLQAQKVALDNLKTPLSIVLTANVVGVSLPDFSAATSNGVSIITDQSGQGTGATLFGSVGKTIGAVGACLGAISSASVSTSIGSVEFVSNLAGAELDVIARGDGALYTSLSEAQVEADSDKGYLKLVKHAGISGTYFNDDVTCAGSGDLNSIRANRTIDKAIRGIAAALTQKLNGPILMNSDGTISDNTAKSFESLAEVPCELMKSGTELSDFSIFVNPNQDVLGTDNINIVVELLPVGAAKFITVNIGFTRSI